MALSLPDAEEHAHMGHPDFRVVGKIFATLNHPTEEHGVILLSPAEQQSFMRLNPEAFAPAKGAWGRRGDTQVRLDLADRATVGKALNAAWLKKAPKRMS